MKKSVALILFLFGFVVGASNLFSAEKILIATGEWPPYTSAELEGYGVVNQIVVEAFAIVGIEVEFEFFPWGRAYERAKEGAPWDGTNSWYYTPERAKDFFVSDPLIETEQVFFHLKDYQFDWQTVDDLAEIHIGATIKYSYGPMFNGAEKENKIWVERVPTDEINFRKLLTGRIKLHPNELRVGLIQLQQTFSPGEVDQITFHPKRFNQNPIHLMLSKKVPANKNRIILFNEGLKRLHYSGRFDEITKISEQK